MKKSFQRISKGAVKNLRWSQPSTQFVQMGASETFLQLWHQMLSGLCYTTINITVRRYAY
jgi:hypothetical protein